MNDKRCLVSFDTDRIKDYIFATPDLRKIRGASALLESLNRADEHESTRTVIRQIYPQIQDSEMITGGGSAMVLVPSEMASQVIRAVEGLYRRTTITASITGASLPVTEHNLENDFGRRVAEVGARLRSAKDQKGQEPIVPLTAWLRPCGACGRYPASYPSPDPEGRIELICRACQIKDEWSNVARNLFWQDFLKQAEDLWLDTFPKDFGKIGQTSRPPGYLGFIYADGNGIGTVLEQIQSFQAYCKFAIGLDEIVRRITYKALLHIVGQPRQQTAPFEILLMGGDDLMLVVAADVALDVALKITEEFEQEVNELAHSPEVGLPAEKYLSLSTGVVIAHDTFPIKAMHDLAAELLKSAKRASSQVANIGTIDFMVVTEAATAGLDVVRDEVLTHRSFVVPPSSGELFFLTERPYTTERLKKLLGWAREFKQGGFPRTTLHAMYEALFESKVQAQFTAIASLARAKIEHQKLGLNFFDDFQVPHATLPWREEHKGEEKHFYSPLGDLIEIYPFV